MTDHALDVSFLVHDAGGWSRDLPDLLACARAGAAAWFELPTSSVVDSALRPARVEHLLEMCDELEEAFEQAVEKVKQHWKDERRQRRREVREEGAA